MKRTYEQTQPVGQPVTTPSSSGQSQQAQPTEPRGLNERILNDLAGKIGHKWTHLAVRLEFQDAEIENFRADHPRSQKERTFQMLKTWWQRWDHLHDADGSGAQDDLCDALEKTGRNDLILFLRGSEDGAGHFNLDAYRDEFIRYYQDEMSVVPLLPWLPSEVSSIHDIYVKPELQERQDKARKVKTRTIESHEDMFKLEYEDGEPVRFILLSGIAGSGKTTNVSKIATDWALQTPRSTSSLSKFTFLVVLSMRELKGVPDLTKAIFDQILAQDTNLDRKSLTTYLSSHAEKVLVVLDGADEYDKEGSQLPSEGFINNIIRNKILRGCTVIVTTRPHMVDKLCKLNPSFIHIETRGFSDEGVQKYIQKFFKGDDSEDSGGLYEYLKASETLRSLARTPIMLLLMCLVWSDEQKLPETLTELFKEALLFILKRHFEKSGLPIPEDKELLENQLIDLLQTLGKEALDGLLLFGQKLVFEARDFGNSEVVDKACKIGILSKEKIRSKLRAVESVTFFHKTFQEAIAGFYWASLVESDNELFKSYLSKVDRDNALGMEYVMRFCCGGNVKAAESLLRYVADTFSWDTEISDVQFDIGLFRDSNEPFRRLWILMHFEAHSAELHDIAGTVFNHIFTVNMDRGNDFKTALNFLVECATSSNQSFLYMLKQVVIQNVLFNEDTSLLTNILRCNPKVTDVHIDLKYRSGKSDAPDACLGEALSRMQSLVRLGIGGHYSNLSAIFNPLSQSYATSLSTLKLYGCSMKCRDLTGFFQNQSKLYELILEDVHLEDDISTLKTNASEVIQTKYVKVLKLLGCDSMTLGILRRVRSFPNLQSLKLVVENGCDFDLMDHVCNLPAAAPQLQVVELKDVCILRNAFPCLQFTKLLHVLKLSFGGHYLISKQIITLVKDVLPLLANIRVLEVSMGSINAEASLAVVQWACASESIDELTLYDCVGRSCYGTRHTNVSKSVSIDTMNATQPTQSSIQKLNVSWSDFGPYTAAFMRRLKQMPFLKELDMEKMSLEQSDWNDLVEGLKNCQQLQKLNLRNFSVVSRLLEAVLRLIPRLPNLRLLNLPEVREKPTQMVQDCLTKCDLHVQKKDWYHTFYQSGIAAVVRVVEQYDME